MCRIILPIYGKNRKFCNLRLPKLGIMTPKEKLAAIRQQMRSQGIDAYIIPSADPHISEYLPERYKCIAWASGFTGSAGTLMITQDFAGLWTDSRYFVQAPVELGDSGYELVKLKVQFAPEFAEWATEHLPKGATVAFDGQLMSVFVAQSITSIFAPFDFKINSQCDLLESLWPDRPALPKEMAYLLPDSLTGESAVQKLARIRENMKAQHADTHLISSLDDIAWTLNIRGKDVPCNPVVLSFLLLEATQTTLFIDLSKLTDEDAQSLKAQGINLEEYSKVWDYIAQLPQHLSWLIDPKRTCYRLFTNISEEAKITLNINPSTHFKANKNTIEIQHMREVMVKDGVALTKFFKWLEENVGLKPMTELSMAEQLRQFRAEMPGFVGESFETIGGYLENGALPHYHATPEHDTSLAAEGTLLVDSGGQYYGGTTDITRVVPLGPFDPIIKEDYTLVLKAMIEGSSAKFPQGTRGYQIDAIVRRPLWDTYRNYGHGTGHGIGFFLNVHEGPHTFNGAAVDIPIQIGMISSIEPGMYRVGQYGVRIENLVLAQQDQQNEFGSFLSFETITLCYIDTDLIDVQWLDQKHIDWLNAYHERVYQQLSPGLTDDEKVWLRQKTAAIQH
jgi:Xaa-Pro aminopeptidase